jgi:hypothetical protein
MACWGHGSARLSPGLGGRSYSFGGDRGDRNRTQKHVARARIILASAARLSVAEVARQAGVGRPAVWRWQRRFVEAGVAGLLRDASRKPGKAPVPAEVVQQVIALTCAEPPGEGFRPVRGQLRPAAGPVLPVQGAGCGHARCGRPRSAWRLSGSHRCSPAPWPRTRPARASPNNTFTRLTFGAEGYDDGSSQQPERLQQAAQGHASAKFSHGWPAAGRMSAFSGAR